MKKLLFCLVSAMLLLGSCRHQPPVLVEYSGPAQGTTFHIKFYTTDSSSVIRHGIDSLLNVIDRTASVFDSGSIISIINHNLGEPYDQAFFDHHFVRIFNKAQQVSASTGGSFDITVGPLVRAWGFWKKKGIELSARQTDSIMQYVGYQKVHIQQKGNRAAVVKQDPHIMLDFNAIAQGYTVDVVSEYLLGRGIQNFLVEIGGEVRASGKKADGSEWMVGIEKPAENSSSDQTLQEKICLQNRSVATSGNYRKYVVRNGIRYPHTLDPHTGRPVNHPLLSVSVAAPDCATADAYGTAFLVMGLDASLAFLAAHPEMDAYFIYSDTSGKMQVKCTPGFEKMIRK